MSQPAPQLKLNELIRRLASVTWSRTGDELEIRRIEAEAHGLMEADPAGAHVVLGGVAAARGNAESTRHHYGVATRLTAQNPTARFHTQRNHSIALAVLEEHDGAFDIVREMLETHPDDVDLLEHALGEAIELANFAEADRIRERLEHLRPTPSNSTRQTTLSLLAEAVKERAFTEAGVRRVLRGVAEVQRHAHLRRISARITDCDGGKTFLYLRGVQAPADEVAMLNERLAEFIASQPDLTNDPGLRFVAAFAKDHPGDNNS